MGKEVECQVRHEGRVARVKALLETDAVILRGEIKATLPLRGLARVEVDNGELLLNDTVLKLGPQAAKWAEKILHPPTLIDKLGIKPGMATAVLGFGDRSFMLDLPYDASVTEGKDYEAILLHAPSVNELGGLDEIRQAIGKKTMLWIIYPKGRKDITESQVFAHGKAIGLVDVKTCRFDDALTGLKFVTPKA